MRGQRAARCAHARRASVSALDAGTELGSERRIEPATSPPAMSAPSTLSADVRHHSTSVQRTGAPTPSASTPSIATHRPSSAASSSHAQRSATCGGPWEGYDCGRRTRRLCAVRDARRTPAQGSVRGGTRRAKMLHVRADATCARRCYMCAQMPDVGADVGLDARCTRVGCKLASQPRTAKAVQISSRGGLPGCISRLRLADSSP